MSRDSKTFNLREGSFPIKMELSFDDTDLTQIGDIKESISGKIEISSISKWLPEFWQEEIKLQKNTTTIKFLIFATIFK